MSAVSATVPSWRTQVLQPMAARAMKITRADGIAIALMSGDEIVCEASAGHAPEVGATVDGTSTWSVRCMRERQPVSFSQSLERGSYSVVLVPLVRSGSAIGFCAAFAMRAEAFTPRHVRVLMRIAETAARSLAAPQAEAPQPVKEAAGSFPARKLSSEQLQEIEREIAAFAAAEKQRARLSTTVKSSVAVLLLIVVSASLFPDRVRDWSYKIDDSIHRIVKPQAHPVHSAATTNGTVTAYAGQ